MQEKGKVFVVINTIQYIIIYQILKKYQKLEFKALITVCYLKLNVHVLNLGKQTGITQLRWLKSVKRKGWLNTAVLQQGLGLHQVVPLGTWCFVSQTFRCWIALLSHLVVSSLRLNEQPIQSNSLIYKLPYLMILYHTNFHQQNLCKENTKLEISDLTVRNYVKK